MSAATADLMISNTASPNFGFSPVASQTWNIPSGRTLIINTNFTIRDNATVTLNNSGTLTNRGWIQVGAVGSTNTVNHNAGTFSSGVSGANAILFIGHSGNAATNGVGVYNLNGGTIALTGSQEIRLGNQSAAGNGTLNVTSGAITSTGSSSKLRVAYNNGSKGAYNQSGGTVTVTTMDIAANNAAGSGTGVATNSGGVLSVTTLNIGTVQTGSLTLNNSGRLNLSGTATVGGPTGGSGTLNLNGGILNMANTAAALVTNSATAIVNANGISITNGSSGNVTLAAPMTLGAGGITNVTLATASGRNITFSGVLTGSGGIMVDIGGANIVSLTGANTYTGGVTIKNGAVESRTTQTTLGTGTVVMGGTGSSGATYRTGQNNTNAFTINAPDSGTNIISANGVGANFNLSGPITLNGNLTLQTFDNPVGASRVTATLSGGVTGTGDLLINNLGLSSNLVNLTTTPINPTGSITQQGTAIGGNTTISAVIGANVTGVTQNSATSTLILSGANTYTGDTTVSAGTLALSGSGSIATTPAITVAGGATFDVSGLSSPPFALGASQTLANGGAATANLVGNISTGSGTNALTYSSGTPSFSTVGNLTLAAATKLTVNNTGAQLGHGAHKLIAKIGSGSVTGTLPTSYSVTNGGAATPNYLWLSGGELYLAVNNTPVARNVTNSVPQGGSVTIPLDNGKILLATDADNDSLTITNVSASLGNVGTDGTSINYTNTTAGSIDLITYTVSDGFGGADTKTITVLITSATGANLVSATAGDGNAYLSYAGIPGLNYALDKATSITPPITWVPQATNTADGQGRLNYTNLLSSWPTNDFFRTRYVP
jgi:autotransporter-associated beta strand protein